MANSNPSTADGATGSVASVSRVFKEAQALTCARTDRRSFITERNEESDGVVFHKVLVSLADDDGTHAQWEACCVEGASAWAAWYVTYEGTQYADDSSADPIDTLIVFLAGANVYLEEKGDDR